MRVNISFLFGLMPASAFVVNPHGRAPRAAAHHLSASLETLESMTISHLKILVKDQNPARGVLSKLQRKQDYIDYLTTANDTPANPPSSTDAAISNDAATAKPSDVIPAPKSDRKDAVGQTSKKGVASFDLAPVQEGTASSPFPHIASTFPGALTNAELMEMIDATLDAAGYDKQKTLVATSLCCDEVNRPLEKDLTSVYDTNFHMGGLAGFPFGGATSFGAMASHIPDGGSCLVVYGPHVGVDSTGAVGTVERRGRAKGGSCCGSAVAAAGYVSSVINGELDKASAPTDPLDAQQSYVGNMVLPYAIRLEDAGDDKMLELPYVLYDAQTFLMDDIVRQSSRAVAGDGTIAVLGGIQINTPPSFSDYFLPLSFLLYDNEGEVIEDLMPKSVAKPFPRVKKIFPGALTNSELVDEIKKSLSEKGYESSKSLVATSFCCDEVNRPLETDLSEIFDTNFNMGGLAGFPFGGATSFGAMAAHIPDGGSCLVVYGPHVGVDSKGAAGTVERRGRAEGGSCCGSAVAAAGYVSSVMNGELDEASPPTDPFPVDAQQYFVGNMILPYAEQLERAEEKMVELPHVLYDAQTELMDRIVGESCGAVAGDGTIAVLGGIQVNTPPGFSDYYLPLRFDLYNNNGELIERIWE